MIEIARGSVRPVSVRLPIRLLPGLAYIVLAVVEFATHGIPISRDGAFVWILGGLFCFSIGTASGFGRSLLTEWLPLLAALTAYDVLRGVGGGRVPIHAEFQIWIDQHLFGTIPTVWLQQHLWNPAHITWFDYGSWAVYMSYYVATPLLLGAIWFIDRSLFRRYARQLTLLSFAAVVVFTLSPTMPPWLASSKGLIGSASRTVGQIGANIHLFSTPALWEQGVKLSNDLAAFPSLHEGMTVLIVIVLWRKARPWARALLITYSLAMAFALTYTAEHYVCDLVAGSLLALAVARYEPALTRRAVAVLHRRRRQIERPVVDDVAGVLDPA